MVPYTQESIEMQLGMLINVHDTFKNTSTWIYTGDKIQVRISDGAMSHGR